MSEPQVISTERFGSRVDDYDRYRPEYPAELEAALWRRCGSSCTAVADIGAGTGKLTRLFAGWSCKVFAVEPDAEMRRRAAAAFESFGKVECVAGTAESTNLPGRSVDLFSAGQAFHWFDHARAHVEFQRVARPAAHYAVIWNERVKGDSFGDAYEALLLARAPDYGKSKHRWPLAGRTTLFGSQPELLRFDNRQRLDFEGLVGRCFSASYVPLDDKPAIMLELRQLFERFEQDGVVEFRYVTHLAYGAISEG